MKATLLLLGSMCAFSLACSGGYSADEAPDTDTASTPRQVARAAETPAADAEQPAADWSAPIAAPVEQPAPVPATTPATGNQPAAEHADAGPAPVANDPPSAPPSAGDAGPPPVVVPSEPALIANDQPIDERGAAGCESGYMTVCERGPCLDPDGNDGVGWLHVCRAALPTDLHAGSPCYADESCHDYSKYGDQGWGYCALPYGGGTGTGSCQAASRPSPDFGPGARCHWHDRLCLSDGG